MRKIFFKKINLKYVVICKNLKVSDIQTAGVPNHNVKTLIIDISFDKRYFERSIHHELFHMIDDSYDNLFSKKVGQILILQRLNMLNVPLVQINLVFL